MRVKLFETEPQSMNTSPFMDKQIMDRSPSPGSEDFIDFMGSQGGQGAASVKEEIRFRGLQGGQEATPVEEEIRFTALQGAQGATPVKEEIQLRGSQGAQGATSVKEEIQLRGLQGAQGATLMKEEIRLRGFRGAQGAAPVKEENLVKGSHGGQSATPVKEEILVLGWQGGQGATSVKEEVLVMGLHGGQGATSVKEEVLVTGLQGGQGATSVNEEILASYDFQPTHHSYSVDVANGGGTGLLNSDDPNSASTNTRKRLAGGKEHEHACITSEIGAIMKKHGDNLLYVLEGVGARLSKLENRMAQLEVSVDSFRVSTLNGYGNMDGRMRQLEIVMNEVKCIVDAVKDRQEILDSQLFFGKREAEKRQPLFPPDLNLSPPQRMPDVHFPPLLPPDAHLPPPLLPSHFSPYYSQDQSQMRHQHLSSSNTPPPDATSAAAADDECRIGQDQRQMRHQEHCYSQMRQLTSSTTPPPAQQESYYPSSMPHQQEQYYHHRPSSPQLYPSQMPHQQVQNPTQGSAGYHPPFGGVRPNRDHPHPPAAHANYPQVAPLSTARPLAYALPTSSAGSGSGSHVPVDDVVDRVAGMGFSRDHVRATVRRLTDNGRSVDLNTVLDKLTTDAGLPSNLH